MKGNPEKADFETTLGPADLSEEADFEGSLAPADLTGSPEEAEL